MCVPTISHPTDRPNYSVVTLGDRTFFFSYSTCVGFHSPDTGTVASENRWSNTTGRHLNLFSDKSDRLPHDQFAAALAAFDPECAASAQPTHGNVR